MISFRLGKHHLDTLSSFLKRYSWTRCSFFAYGSLTVEAALVFPLMMLFMAVLIAPLYAMEEQRQLQNRLEAAAKDMSQAAYIKQLSAELINKDSGIYEAASEIADVGLSLVAVYKAVEDIDQKVLTDISITEAYGIMEGSKGEDEETDDETALTDSELINFKVEYEPYFPLKLRLLSAGRLSSVTSRRKWIGSDGGRGRSKYGEELIEDGYELDDEGNQIVYVGKGSTRYHKDKNCHYISNVLIEADGGSVGELRNSYGAKYHACPSCDAKAEGTVYIFENGTAFHSSEDCKAVVSYARSCKLSEVEHLGPCSYCSK